MHAHRFLAALAAVGLAVFAAVPGAHADAAPPAAPRIEVAFALDATGSMEPFIAQARSKIRQIAADLATGTPKPDVRFALVAYRDKGDEFVTKVTPFTRDIEAMHHALDQTQAGGGGDTPESVLEGLRDAVTGLQWTAPEDTGVVRLVYLVGDAPPHNYPDSPTEEWITSEARRRRIAIHGIVCGSDFKTVEPIFEAVARHTEGRIFRLGDSVPGTPDGSDRHSSSLASAMTDTTKAYSSSIGVSFGGPGAAPIPTSSLGVPRVAASGLVGAHVRWVRDASSWKDLWAAHVSLMAVADRPAPPSVDFAKQQVLVLGGSDGGLELEALVLQGDRRAARVHPAKDRAVRFLLVPASGATSTR